MTFDSIFKRGCLIPGIIILFFSVFVSVKIFVTRLDKKDLAWMTGYDRYEPRQNIFVSDNGNVDTVEYDSKWVVNKTDVIEFSSAGGGWTFEAYACYTLGLRHNGHPYRGSVSIKRAVDNDTLLVGLSLGQRETVNRKRNDEYIVAKPETLMLDSVVYRDCVVADNSNSRILESSEGERYRGQPVVDKFIVSKRHGLVYYRFDDGEEFVRRR